MRKYFFAALLLFNAVCVSAQSAISNDSLSRKVDEINSQLQWLRRIKLSGFVQAQYQWADRTGMASVAGGDFPASVAQRFKVRRAEFKTRFSNDTVDVVANIDVTQSGVAIKDAYGKFTVPTWKSLSFTAGIFSRPFGWEVPYSSGMLESPERSRIIQTLFPGERDLGAMLSFTPNKTSKLNPLTIEAGMFNGTGNRADDFDNIKDFIGNIHWRDTAGEKKIKFVVGVNGYFGGWNNGSPFVYRKIGILPNGDRGFILDTSLSNKNVASIRQYLAGDFEIIFNRSAWKTIIRGEYIQGIQPGTWETSVSPSSIPSGTRFRRNFIGAYFYFVQNIAKSKHQLIIKYDWYDANADVSGGEIGKAGTNLSKADLKYTALALGWSFNYSKNIKFIAYYDIVENETSANLVGYEKDLKDNVYTLRTQFKF